MDWGWCLVGQWGNLLYTYALFALCSGWDNLPTDILSRVFKYSFSWDFAMERDVPSDEAGRSWGTRSMWA